MTAPPSGPPPAIATPEAPAAPHISFKERLHRLPRAARVAVIVVVVLMLAAFYWWLGYVSTDDAQVDAHITAVASQVSGYAIKLMIDDNVKVKEGDVLVQIDPREYQAEVDQARAALDFAQAAEHSAQIQIGLTRGTTTNSTGGATAQKQSDEADYAMAQVQLERAATANLQQAKAEVAARQATNERAQADLERYTPLLQTGDVSKFQFDAVEATARVAKSDLEAAQQQLAAAQQEVAIARANASSTKAKMARSQSLLLESKAQEQQIPISEATYKSAVANVERAKATLEQAVLNLNYATIKAPITGQVTQKTVNLGQYVLPGQLLFTLVPLDRIYVTANFKETQMSHVRPGQKARIYVDTYGRYFEGVVDSIAGATGSRQALLPPQNATGNFIKVVQRIPVKILVTSTDGYVLRPGMNVEATIYTH